jgi:hypothetical protein
MITYCCRIVGQLVSLYFGITFQILLTLKKLLIIDAVTVAVLFMAAVVQTITLTIKCMLV